MPSGRLRWFTLSAVLLASAALQAEAPRGTAAEIAISPVQGARLRAAVLPDMQAFGTLDANGDGYLVRGELDPDFCAQFEVVDLNKDGLISAMEYQIHAERRSLMADIVKAYMLREDKNRDGLLSRTEFKGRPAAFVWADVDENNTLHHAELMRMVGSDDTFQYNAELFFKSHDLDRDGAIVIDEWTKVESNRALFSGIDLSGNDVLMPDEVFTFLYRYERRLDVPAAKARVERRHQEERRYIPSSEGQG